MSSSIEQLQELLVDLERARQQEAVQRHTAECLILGLEVLLNGGEATAMYERLLAVLQPGLGFEAAMILGTEAVADELRPLAWTRAAFEGCRFPIDPAMRRVIDGRPLAAFDITRLPSWMAQTAAVRASVTSALHLALHAEGDDAVVLVCVHSERGAFGQAQIALAKRLGLLGSLAVRQERGLRRERLEQRRLHQVISNAPVILWSIAADGVIEAAAGQGLSQLGYEAEPLVGRRLVDAGLGPVAEAALTALHGESSRVTGPIRGSVVDTQFSPREGGGAVGVSVDVTAQHEVGRVQELNDELLRARDAAIAATKTKSRFLANMSHELRTPLNAIIGFAEVLGEDLQEAGNQQGVEDVARIHAAGHHLLSLINSVLDLSRVESGKMRLDVSEFWLGPVLHEVSELVRPLISCAFRVEGIVPDVRLTTDRMKLRQVLLNLLSNAFKFTIDGEVCLMVTRGDQEICFQVVDSGQGMNQEQLQQVFEPFVQVDSSSTRRAGGSGLGLALCKQFVEMMNGTIGVSSRVGVGTTFHFTLPWHPVAQVLPAVPARPGAGGPLVYIVDHDVGFHEIVRRTLHPMGYRTRSIRNAKSVVRRARDELPSVILLDVKMPGVDGWELLEELKTDDVARTIPVVVITIVDEVALAFQLGAANYLRKPVDRQALLTSLETLAGEGVGREVLVVEDDPDARALVCKHLARGGWIVRQAVDGEEGLAEMCTRVPDVVVLDLMMPGVNGFTFLATIRRELGLNTPVVVLTAATLSAEQGRFLNTSASRVLQKGLFPITRLERVLQEVLGDAAAVVEFDD